MSVALGIVDSIGIQRIPLQGDIAGFAESVGVAQAVFEGDLDGEGGRDGKYRKKKGNEKRRARGEGDEVPTMTPSWV